MDHYNATVHNGALVSTRRGLHVSKTKHHGTRFVNTFAAPTAPTTSSSSSKTSSSHKKHSFSQFQANKQSHPQQPPQERKFTFVDKPGGKPRAAPRGRPRRPVAKASSPSSSSDSGEEALVGTNAYPKLDRGSDSPPLFPLSQDEFLAVCTPGSTYIPKQWKTHRFGHDLPDLSQKLVHMYLQHTPRQLYPCEELLTYNPVRDPRFFNRINTDAVTMQSILMTAALMGSLQLGASADDINTYIMNVCAMVNQRLVDETGENDPAVLESIAAMAIAGLFMGRQDLWHVHMKGLRYIIARNGGLSAEWGHVLNKIRKADIKGAAYTGELPYLEFTRFFSPISDVLSSDLRGEFSLSVQRILQRNGIAQITIDSIRDLVLVAQSIVLARHAPSGSILFDPQSYSEEYMWVEYQLVRYPGPLRKQNVSTENSYPSGYSPPGEPDTSTYRYEQPFDNSVVPAQAANILDPVVRICGILYLEELLPEPRTMDPYSVPLSLLNQHVREIVLRLRDREAAFLAGAPSSSTSSIDGLPGDIAALRPLLLWVCMVAYTLAQIVEADVSFINSGAQPVDRAPYQDCVVLLVGGDASPAGVDALPERDLELARLLPVQELRVLGYDDRVVLKQIVGDYEARQMAAIAPFL